VIPLLLLLLLDGDPSLGGVSASERQVLLELFDSTGGPTWTNPAGWGGRPGTECSWAGIECRPVQSIQPMSQVHAIDLTRNHLTGSLPASLASLPGLTTLDLTDSGISTPLPEALLARWEQGLLDIRGDLPLTDITEIRLFVSTNVWCANEAIILKNDGTVTRYRERCRKPRATDPRPYCEIRRAKTREFSRVARFLASNGFYASHERPLDKGVWVDVPIVTVSVTDPRGVHAVEVLPNGDDSLQAWSYDAVIRGTIADLDWSKPEIRARCPYP
jgi:hypothetical protein